VNLFNSVFTQYRSFNWGTCFYKCTATFLTHCITIVLRNICSIYTWRLNSANTKRTVPRNVQPLTWQDRHLPNSSSIKLVFLLLVVIWQRDGESVLCNDPVTCYAYTATWEDNEISVWSTGGVKQTVFRVKPGPVPRCSPQIPYGLLWDRAQVSAVRGWYLTIQAMAQPSRIPKYFLLTYPCLLNNISRLHC
jgi:hypothetical protein